MGVGSELLRKHDASLRIRLALGGIGKERAHGLGLCVGQTFKLFGEARPGSIGIDAQAGIHAHGDIKRVAQFLAQLRRNKEPPLGIDRMLILTCHGGSLLFWYLGHRGGTKARPFPVFRKSRAALVLMLTWEREPFSWYDAPLFPTFALSIRDSHKKCKQKFP